MKYLALFTIVIIVFNSCEKEENSDPVTPFSADSGGVYISNEGKFQSGNSSISYFSPASNLVYPDAYQQANHQSLGDVCQSMAMINGKIFLVVNNSGKIEICDPYSMVSQHTITGFTSPRFILQVGNTKAYVSDLFSNYISIVNLNNYTIAGTIAISGWTEQMIIKNNLVYVTNTFSDYLYIIDPVSDYVSDSILISKGANSICEDGNGKVWVLCGDDYMGTYEGALYKIDPIFQNIESQFNFSGNENPSRLCRNPSGDSLYYLNSGVFKMSVSDNSLPALPFVASSGNQFYGLSVDKRNNIVYVSDAIDFIQRGKVYRYSANGMAIDNFLAGILPGDFLFLD